MKLIRAKFRNFRLLQDLELHFSVQPDKKLTVIRAANDSGKTTILRALQWALYGDEALPNKGDKFRLHPIGWAGSGSRVPISVQVELEIPGQQHTRGGRSRNEQTQRILIDRSAYENTDNGSTRTESAVKLFIRESSGDREIREPDSYIREILPLELREVFFTDGDRALAFIEADVSLRAKRKRVQNAIRALLALDIILNAISHTEKSLSETNRKAKQIKGHSELHAVTSRISEIEEEKSKLLNDIEDYEIQLTELADKISESEDDISKALQKGDREKLQHELESTKGNIKFLDNQLDKLNKKLSALLSGKRLSMDLLDTMLKRQSGHLRDMHDEGKIPHTTVPVLKDRLNSELCICGESLKSTDPGGANRRSHIEKLIEDSQRADEVQKIITGLYYGHLMQKSDTDDDPSWTQQYSNIITEHDEIIEERNGAGRKYNDLEQQLDEIPNTDIQILRNHLRELRRRNDKAFADKVTCETKLETIKTELSDLTDKRGRLLRDVHKGARINAELTIIEDVKKILQASYEQMTNEELSKVSNLMNEIFLEMIGADPKNSIIARAVISNDFDIIVYGSDGRTLDPDRDLNGASRRALTLAFILALTKISEVEAPNVIDTPLGMASGFVKYSILQTSLNECSQLILLLTHDEINGCEQIIEKAAGEICTLTNPAHYPKILIHDPNTNEQKVLRCDCDHKSFCKICERRTKLPVS